MGTGILVKIGDQKFMNRLLQRGEVYVRPLHEFSKVEKGQRGDPLEVFGTIVTSRAKPVVKIQPQKPDGSYFDELTVRPISVSLPGPRGQCGAYCMSLFRTDRPFLRRDPENTIQLLSPTSMHIHACTAMKEFGDWGAIFHDSIEFVRRLVEAGRRAGLDFESRKVEYVDGDGGVFHLESGFRKIRDYLPQNEWRFLANKRIEKALVLRLGSLEDIGLLQDLRPLWYQSSFCLRTGNGALSVAEMPQLIANPGPSALGNLVRRCLPHSRQFASKDSLGL